MAQNIVVALLVGACFFYSVWTLGPKAPRSRLANMLLKLPLPSVLQKPLAAAARQQGGCGCNGCARSTAAKNPSAPGAEVQANKPGFQPIVFVRGNYAKKAPR